MGVSIVICCHNSARRLPQTLAHLQQQNVRQEQIPWEVIVVDNASTDNTTQTALSLWPPDAPALLRVVHEPRPGLSFARQKGFTEAQYDVIGFVDDDNWLSSDWVSTVHEVMQQHLGVGACGGFNHSAFESTPPPWFAQFQEAYAVGPQSEASGDVTWTRGYLWGAGLAVRKAAWEQISSKGFRPLLSGRQGQRLVSGDDSEICYALRLAGWRLWYDERLQLTHYMPADRLTWSYLRRLVYGFGKSTTYLDAYHVSQPGPTKAREKARRLWIGQVCQLLGVLTRERKRMLHGKNDHREGNSDRIWLDWHIGRLSELLHQRGQYAKNFSTVGNAPWRVCMLSPQVSKAVPT